MSAVAVSVIILHTLAYVLLYVIVGFGPGFVLGMIVANTLFGRGQPTYMQLHEENKKRAAQHNAQWAPSHERWQK